MPLLRLVTRTLICVCLVLAAPLVAWLLVHQELVAATVAGRSVETGVRAVCAAALLAGVGWLAVTTAVAMLAELATAVAPGSRPTAVLGRASEHACPRLSRRLAVVVIGVVATSGVSTGAALADPPLRPGAAVLSGLPLPERPTGSGLSARTPTVLQARRSARPAAATVLVRPGDSLWSLAARLLPPGADDAAVTTAWHRLHRANADVLGPDPDLILPGTHLRVPHLTG